MYNYIITTDDFSAANNKILEIKNSIKYELDEVSYDLEEDGIYSIIDELSTVSLFDTPKFVVVKSAEVLLTFSDKAVLELATIMNDMDSSNVLILLSTKGFDTKSEKYQRIKRFSTYIDIKMKNISLDKFAIRELEKDEYKIDNEALSLLCSYSPNLSYLEQYIEVLKCYKMNDKKITDKDIIQMVQKPLDDNVYQLIEAVIKKDKKGTFACYNDLKIINLQPSYLVSLLISKFQELYNVQVLTKSGLNQNDISNLFNVSSGRAYYMIKNAKSISINEIKNNLEYLNKLEYEIKSGKVDQALGLELYFLR